MRYRHSKEMGPDIDERSTRTDAVPKKKTRQTGGSSHDGNQTNDVPQAAFLANPKYVSITLGLLASS